MNSSYVLMRMAKDHQREMWREAEMYGLVRSMGAPSRETVPEALKRLVGLFGRFLVAVGHRLEGFGRPSVGNSRESVPR